MDILDHLNNLKVLGKNLLKTSYFWFFLAIAIFLIGQSFALNSYANYSPFQNDNFWGSGGGSPENNIEGISGALSGAAPVSVGGGPVHDGSIISEEGGSAIGSSHPFSNIIPTRDGLRKYKVREGDTLSSISSEFGVSLDTIRLANPDTGSTISPGEEITILPVSGILYKIKEGDTLEGVASTYSADTELIKEYNNDYQDSFESPGSTIVLPFVKPLNRLAYIRNFGSSLPKMDDYFQLPAEGYLRGELHYYNAIDISAPCGEDIFASQEGIIVEESSQGLWNSGYGNYLIIEHPNGTKTRYSHNLKNLFSVGDYVMQGEVIALIGDNGNSTGCHLHFEVHGAQNPFATS